MLNSHQVLESLQDRIAIVTGSGRGIGAAIAKKLAELGVNLVINDLNHEQASQVADEIKKMGRKAQVSNHDVSNYASAYDLVAFTKKTFGRVDILINNAGITRDALLHKTTEEKWDEVIRVNLKGPFNMGQACAKEMMEQRFGKIINIASVAMLGNVGQTNYSATKAGVAAMTSTWALELAKYQITVNAVAPGFIQSTLTDQIPAEIKEKFIERIPLKRIGKPEEIAQVVAFLVSNQASYITGQCLIVDGGLTTGA